MINLLSYIGITLQSELCLWTLLGLLRTIFDATLFKVNANLIQVWQMNMPKELTIPVQRVLRTMISGVMLVQCFTLYVYLASYIVLLYPVFLEERPTLVLPWLLLAAIRKLLCELTSLALGLGTCVLLGPARPSCIKFLIIKVVSIMPALYMWILVFSYYGTLKLATAFKTFPAVLPASDQDYGLELAVRRRRTKSLLDEEQLRSKLMANFYGDRHEISKPEPSLARIKIHHSSRVLNTPETSFEDLSMDPLPVASNRMMSEIYEDWFGNVVTVPRDSDRILQQFCVMLLRIGAYMKREDVDTEKLFESYFKIPHDQNNLDTALHTEATETPPLVGSKGRAASYLRDYPHIFMKKPSEIPLQLNSEHQHDSLRIVHSQNDTIPSCKRTSCLTSDQIPMDIERYINRKSVNIKNQQKSTKRGHSEERTFQNSKIESPSNDSFDSVVKRIKDRLSANVNAFTDENESSTLENKAIDNLQNSSTTEKRQRKGTSRKDNTNKPNKKNRNHKES